MMKELLSGGQVGMIVRDRTRGNTYDVPLIPKLVQRQREQQLNSVASWFP
jgi:hypothetical protein